MSDIVVGIDLGTTNSCIAVPETADIPNRDALIADGRLVPVGGGFVLTDRVKAVTTPSAVWIDRDGSVIVGRKAKQKARLPGEPPPAMFFKRIMGTTERVRAGHAVLTAEEASSHVLRHLADVAADLLQTEITRAVVTVPAFFKVNARQATTRAGELAGLEVVDTLLEPVAAALMYTRTRTLGRPETFMVYDLGGGTFDVSVVTWDPDVGFEMRSFDGDTFLGGYDFDRSLANWMIERLRDGYHLDLDIEHEPRDAAIFARFLLTAEVAKVQLSLPGDTGLETTITDTTAVDRAGDLMNIHLDLTRADFEGLIAERVDRTLASSDRALQLADVAAGDVSEIIMVGGSSRIPLVCRKLEEKYGRQPEVIDPDLCVAVGASLKASTAPSRTAYLVLDQPPQVTSLDMVDVSGEVHTGADLDQVADVTVVLTSDDGTYRREETTNKAGRFLFDDVPLAEEAANTFAVRVLADGREIDAQPVTVEHRWEGGPPQIPRETGAILPHDVSLAVVGGYHVVAPAGTKLPSQRTVTLESVTQRGSLAVDLYEGHDFAGEVQVEELPRDLPLGSDVLVDLVFNDDWSIDAEARVPAADAVGTAKIVIHGADVPDWPELRQFHQELLAAWQEKQAVADPRDLLRAGPQIDALLSEAADLLNEGQDRPHAAHCLAEARTLIDAVAVNGTVSLQPPWEKFEAGLKELDALIGKVAAKEAQTAQRFRSAAATLRTTGKQVYDAENAADWAYVNDNLATMIAQAHHILEPPPQLPPAPLLMFSILQELRGITEAARQIDRQTSGRYRAEVAEIETEGQAIDGELQAVDLEDESAAQRRLVTIYMSRLSPLRARVEQLLARPKADEGEIRDVGLPGKAVSDSMSQLRSMELD